MARRGRLSQLRYRSRPTGGGFYEHVWNLVDAATVTITDRRLTYFAHLVKQKAPGVATGARAVLASARPQRWDRLQAGHLHFDWPVNVMLTTNRILRSNYATLSVTLRGDSGGSGSRCFCGMATNRVWSRTRLRSGLRWPRRSRSTGSRPVATR